jgi:hypothetical protein
MTAGARGREALRGAAGPRGKVILTIREMRS